MTTRDCERRLLDLLAEIREEGGYMTTRDCERRLLDLLAEAWMIFQAYDPKGTHLTMFATADGHCVMGYKPSAEGKERIVDGYLSPSGDYRLSKSWRDDR